MVRGSRYFVFLLLFASIFALIFFGIKNQKTPQAYFLKSLKAMRGLSSQKISSSLELEFITNTGPRILQVKMDSAHNYFSSSQKIQGILRVSLWGAGNSPIFEEIVSDMYLIDAKTLYLNLQSPSNIFAMSLKPILNEWIEVKSSIVFPNSEIPKVSFFEMYRKYPFLEWAKKETRPEDGILSFSFQSEPKRLQLFFKAFTDKIFPEISSGDENAKSERQNIVKNLYLFGENLEVSGDMKIRAENLFIQSLNISLKNFNEELSRALHFPKTARVAMTFTGQNENGVISPPESAISFRDAFQLLTGTEWEKFLESARNVPKTENPLEKDSDEDGLVDTMEYRLKTDKLNPDTDGDGYLDGVEFENGYNPLGGGKM